MAENQRRSGERDDEALLTREKLQQLMFTVDRIIDKTDEHFTLFLQNIAAEIEDFKFNFENLTAADVQNTVYDEVLDKKLDEEEDTDV